MNRTAAISLLLILAACSKSAPQSTAGPLPQSALPERYLLATPPADAQGVLAAKTAKELPAHVAITGKVHEFVGGRSALVITDTALKSCDQEGPMQTCPTPWDYCCSDPREVAAASATVEFRDGAELYRTDARGFHGLDYLAKVTVTGTPKLDDAGNLTVVADGIYLGH